LALWSFGLVLARSCALTAGSPMLAKGRKRTEQTVRQQRRAWDDDTPRTRGPQRHALHVETGCAPLLGWVVRWWQGPPLALALAATTLGQRLVVVAVRVGERGGALPVAWGILPAGPTPAWRREWLRRVRRLPRAIPRAWTVSVWAERGLDAPWRLRRITRGGGPPWVRRNPGGRVRPAGATGWGPCLRLVPRPGTSGRGTGIACPRTQRPCTRLARWAEGDQAPGLIRTARAPEARDAGWDGWRAWMAQGCNMTKRAGGPWHRTRRRDPDRAARLWLAVAVATWWLLRVGEGADETMPVSTLRDVTGRCPERPRTRRATRLRLVRVLRQGWGTLVVALLRPEPLPQGGFVPAPWPVVPPLEEEGPAPVKVMPKAA
jgi:hypothetical protein